MKQNLKKIDVFIGALLENLREIDVFTGVML